MIKDKTKIRKNSGQKPSGSQAANWQYKVGLLLLFQVAYAVFYVLPNFNPLFEPKMLPLLLIDRTAPFLPWTFVVYLSEYVLIGITIYMIKDRPAFSAFARQSYTALFIIGSIFYLLPTIYPRPLYPPQENLLVAFAMNIITTVDAPTNCFPSLHVAITSVAVYALRFLTPKVWFIYALWGVAIFASTLTTKQHYFMDVIGGLIAASGVIFFDGLLFQKKNLTLGFPRLSKRELQNEQQLNLQKKLI